MSTVPTIALNNGCRFPSWASASTRSRPRTPRQRRWRPSRSATGTSTPPRCTATSEAWVRRVRESGLDRGDVFVTSKLNNGFHAHDDALAAFDEYARRPGLRLPRPVPHPLAAAGHDGDFVETWQALEEIYRSGRAKSIGVSNFHAHHLRRLLDETEIVPAVNQIEVHPYLDQDEVRAFDAEHGIATEAWSPIAQGKVLDDRSIAGIAKRHGRTPAQVTLRWHIQRGDIVFPKSVTRSRVEENFDALRLRALRRRHGRHHRAQPRRAHRARTPTSSTGSPDRHDRRLSQTVTATGAGGYASGHE